MELISVILFDMKLYAIQRNLQLRIGEQGRYLQMMFEKQSKSGVEPFKASSSAIEKCFGFYLFIYF
ncbi:myb-CC type transfactor, lheqle motif protein [Medicago truncatula]|uniref:Myb-CC type transfactor, lheqle motif protein n=1 Tax=Medicago truncatula TaxID=3880 RepID=G7KAW2_MEDTR|nr:myb-CC type transfactor, lheqle motif protein [Medicago truncatula]